MKLTKDSLPKFSAGATWMEASVLEFLVKHRLINPGAEAPTKSQQFERIKMHLEELSELAAAMERDDRVAVADALGDILYVLIGTFLMYNVPMRPVFDEIHRSNMTKQRSNSANVKPIKGASYEPPKLKELLSCIAKSKSAR